MRSRHWVRDPKSHRLVCAKCRKSPVKVAGDGYGGHDPCIARLPGVMFACCGHGVSLGYVVFEDGRTLRGVFDHHKKESKKMGEALEAANVLNHVPPWGGRDSA